MEALISWDAAGLALLHSLRAGWLDSLFLALTWLGSLAVLLPLALLTWWWRRGDSGAAFVALALVGASALGHLAKLIAARPRPDLFPPLIAMPEDWSFPSAHAVQATAFVLAWLLRPGASPRRIELVALPLAAFAVFASRPYLQVHFPSDVIAGILLASFWVLLLRRLPAWREAGR